MHLSSRPKTRKKILLRQQQLHHRPFETSKSVPSEREIFADDDTFEAVERFRQKMALRVAHLSAFHLPPAPAPARSLVARKTFVVFHKHAVRSSFAPPLPYFARIRSFVACPPGGILP